MNRIWGFLIFLGLLGCVWNVIAFLLSLMGFHPPVIDAGY